MEELKITSENKPERDEKGRLLPGNTANPLGRPKGSGNPLKQYQREKFEKMTDEEKEEFLDKIAPDLRWRMAEGNPKQESEISGNEDLPFFIKLIKKKDERKNG